jgi:hypothetical protein
MKEVVVERPRGQSYVPNRKFGARLRYIPGHDYEEQPKRVGISASYRDYGYSEKWPKDLLGPLLRFLQKNIGHPWDKVYSEICSTLDRREITGHHLISHLKCEVETNCFIGSGGKVLYLRHGVEQCAVDGFYVHPQTGLLCLALPPDKRALKRWRLLAEEITWLKIDDTRGYRKHAGIWYHAYFRNVFVSRYQQPEIVRDIFLKKDVRLNYGWNLLLVTKKQCNRDELRRVRYMLQKRRWSIERI